MEDLVLEAILKSGLLGALAVYFIYQNSKLVEKIISVGEKTIVVLTELKAEIQKINEAKQ